MAYSTISKPSLHFNTKLYTANNGTQSITGVGFQPDWTWIKCRSAAYNHALFDSVRGATKLIRSNQDTSEETHATTLTAFDSNGFSLGGNDAFTNNGSETYASWNWKAGGSGSANTDGSINSTVSANTTAGFSIITYTGTGSAGTIGHGLGVVPDFWMVKARSETRAWYGWHKGMSYGDVVNFNSNGAKSTDTSLFTSNAPTNQVINLGTSVGTNNNGINFVCYAFSSKAGYSKFGKYIGNGNADGTFVYTGFKPAFLIVKRIDGGTENWGISDNQRLNNSGNQDGGNGNYVPHMLATNSSNAESNFGGGSSNEQDYLSNGFKIRSANAYANTSGATYIYMAFAEEPLVANVGASIPATAR